MILPSLVLLSALAAGPQMVIPPGEENLIMAMAAPGEPAPDGCRLDIARTISNRVEVGYVCDGGTRSLVLRHKDDPEAKGAAVIRTEQFAIIPGDPPPPKALLDNVERQVRAHEGEFVWVGGAPRADSELPTPPPMNLEALGNSRELAQQYMDAFNLYRQGEHEKAYALFVEMAKKYPTYPGVLGMVVANLAPQKPDEAKVKALQADADAHPDDPLRQFIAGVGAHYSAHYMARTREDKKRLYRQAIQYLSRTLPAYDFEPRVYIYLAVSHFRLGEQKEAEETIEKAIALNSQDPDAYYCRAEIFQRADPDQALADIQKYFALTEQFQKMGSPVPEGKLERVKRMQAQLEATKRGETPTTELWDPLTQDGAATEAPLQQAKVERSLPRLVIGSAVIALGALAVILLARRRKSPTDS